MVTEEILISSDENWRAIVNNGNKIKKNICFFCFSKLSENDWESRGLDLVGIGG